jgi:hypothetical protein
MSDEVGRALEKRKEATHSYRGRVQYVAICLTEQGFPNLAKKLENNLLFGDESSGTAALDEAEGLVEVLNVADPLFDAEEAAILRTLLTREYESHTTVNDEVREHLDAVMKLLRKVVAHSAIRPRG